MAIAEIHVTLKPTLLDAQGRTVAKALNQLGYSSVRDVRIGKFITVEVDETQAGAGLQRQLEEMCQKLLANPVIEDFEITMAGAPGLLEPPIERVPNAPLPPSPTELGDAPGTPRSALSPAEQIATAQISSSATATPDPFAIDYAQFESLAPGDKLAMQELAWREHGPWILRQLGDRRAQWVLVAGGEVVDSGDSLDTFPSDERRAELGAERSLVPWVFVRPPAS
jgi:phosphoribosylformylglycinamidine synthase